MKKCERVTSKEEFSNIINRGSRVKNDYYTIFYMDNKNGKTLYGVSAPVRLGNAVERNRIKRQTRALIDDTKNLFKNNRNYIIIVKEGAVHSTYENRINALKNLIGEMNEK